MLELLILAKTSSGLVSPCRNPPVSCSAAMIHVFSLYTWFKFLFVHWVNDCDRVIIYRQTRSDGEQWVSGVWSADGRVAADFSQNRSQTQHMSWTCDSLQRKVTNREQIKVLPQEPLVGRLARSVWHQTVVHVVQDIWGNVPVWSEQQNQHGTVWCSVLTVFC